MQGKPNQLLLHHNNRSSTTTATTTTITRSRSTSAAPPPRSSSAFSLSLSATPASTPLRPIDLDVDCVRALVQREEEQLRLKKHQSFDTAAVRDWSSTAANIMASTDNSSSLQSGNEAAAAGGRGAGKTERTRRRSAAGASTTTGGAGTPSTSADSTHNVAQSFTHHHNPHHQENQSMTRASSSQAGSSTQTRATFHSHASSSHEGRQSSSSSTAAATAATNTTTGRDHGSSGSGIIRSGSAWFQKKIHLRPQSRGVHLITDELLKQIPELGEFLVGLVHIQVMHTSASLALNEVRIIHFPCHFCCFHCKLFVCFNRGNPKKKFTPLPFFTHSCSCAQSLFFFYLSHSRTGILTFVRTWKCFCHVSFLR